MMYIFVEGDFAILISINFTEVPVKLFLSDGSLIDSEIVSQESSELLFFEGRALVFIVSFEDRFEMLFDNCLKISHFGYEFNNKKILIDVWI